MKNKFKSYAFIMSLTAGVIAVLVALGNAFGFKVDEIAISSIVTAIVGVFVTLGFVIKDTKDEDSLNMDQKDESKDDVMKNSLNIKQDKESTDKTKLKNVSKKE